MEPLTGHHSVLSLSSLQILDKGWSDWHWQNTLAYYDKDKITAVKNFKEQALGGAVSRTNVIKPFTAVFLNGPTKLERFSWQAFQLPKL